MTATVRAVITRRSVDSGAAPAVRALRFVLAALPLVVVVEAVLLATGVLQDAWPLIVLLGVEVSLFVLFTGRVLLLSARHRRAHGTTWRAALVATVRPLVPALAWRFLRHELRTLRDLYRWARGFRNVPDDSVHVFAATQGVFVLPLAGAGISIVEAGVVHFLIPWDWLRLVLLLATVETVLLLLGLVASHVVNPHAVTHDTVILKLGNHEVTSFRLAEVESAARTRRIAPVNPELAGDTLALASQDGTNVEIRLRQPVSGHIPNPFGADTTSSEISIVRCQVNDPEGFVRAVRPA